MTDGPEKKNEPMGTPFGDIWKGLDRSGAFSFGIDPGTPQYEELMKMIAPPPPPDPSTEMNTEMLVFCDLETTGLDPRRHQILEMCLLIVDEDLTEIDCKTWLIDAGMMPRYPSMLDAGMMPRYPSMLDPVVYYMHSENGLWSDLSKDGHPPVHVVERQAMEFLEGHQALDTPLCGNGVHFDRAFIRAQMPKLHELFHYRNFDVSSVHNMASLWAPNAQALLPTDPKVHRATDDTYAALHRLRYYRDSLFSIAENAIQNRSDAMLSRFGKRGARWGA